MNKVAAARNKKSGQEAAVEQEWHQPFLRKVYRDV